MGKKITENGPIYHVKWENYSECTWEPMENIPNFIINYFERTGKNDIPAARIKHTKVIGDSKFHLLVWDDEDGEMFWEQEDSLFSNIEFSCNTKKDKDKRICRHSFGVLFGCYPCGVGGISPINR